MAYDNTNSGALFKNDRRTQDNHPNARGEATIVCPHCQEPTSFWLSAWTKAIKNGNRAGEMMQSLSFTPKDQDTKSKARSRPAPPPDMDGFDDDIPF